MIGKNTMVIGNVDRELGFGRISIGEKRWKWRRRLFSRFSVEPHRWINPHMIIVGGSGGGKSNACKAMVSALCAGGAHVAILDPHDEYLGICGAIDAKVYDASRNGINMFDLDGVTERERTSEITSMLKRNFRLGEVQGYVLYRCIAYSYRVLLAEGKTPNIHNLMFTIKIFKKNSKSASEKTVLESLERRISLLDTGAFEKSADVNKVMSGNSVFLLSRLHTPEAQSIYMEGFLRKVYSRMLSMEKASKPRLYVVIDEAEKLGDNPILGKIAAEGRKYGIGIIAISQRSKLIDKDLRGNAATLISFGIKEPEELNYVANFISGGTESGRFIEVKKALRSIGRGRAIVMGSHMRNPQMVSFMRSDANFESLEFRISELARDGINGSVLAAKLDGARGAQEKIGEMLSEGTLKKHEIACGSYSGEWFISNSHNSAEHDIAVNIISRHLASLGISNRIYNSAYGPDIVAFHAGNAIAIEYETGSKDIEASVRMIKGRANRYAKTIVVVNDEAADAYSKVVENVVPFSHLEKCDLEHMICG
jgi:hypothetical protein